MHALKDLFTSDVGLMSVAGIAFMLGMGVFFLRYFARHIKEDTARAAVAAAPVTAAPARSRATTLPATAQATVQDNFDRTWRQVGLALDRSGFTVEDRDRSAGLYFVRYVDPKMAGKDEPGFFSKLFGGSKETARPQRVRVLVSCWTS